MNIPSDNKYSHTECCCNPPPSPNGRGFTIWRCQLDVFACDGTCEEEEERRKRRKTKRGMWGGGRKERKELACLCCEPSFFFLPCLLEGTKEKDNVRMSNLSLPPVVTGQHCLAANHKENINLIYWPGLKQSPRQVLEVLRSHEIGQVMSKMTDALSS